MTPRPLRPFWPIAASILLSAAALAAPAHAPKTAGPVRTAAPAHRATTPSRATPAALDPSSPGPYPVIAREFLASNGAPTDFDLYLPAAPGVFPAVVLGHGFSQYKDYQHDNGTHLASWGFVVLAPSFSSFADHEANAEEMLELADWLLSSENPYQAQVDPDALGLAGHSAGGLSATIAAGLDATRDRRIAAVMGLDPVDVVQGSTSQGIPYAKDIDVPAFYLTGIPYSCNSNGNAQGMFDAIPPGNGRMFLRITRAVHCDFNDQDIDHACTPGMEPARPAKILRLLVTEGWAAAYDAATAGVCAVEGQELDRSDELRLIRQYLAAWFLAQLAGDPAALSYLYDGAALQADLRAGVVEELQY